MKTIELNYTYKHSTYSNKILFNMKSTALCGAWGEAPVTLLNKNILIKNWIEKEMKAYPLHKSKQNTNKYNFNHRYKPNPKQPMISGAEIKPPRRN